jgi:hypothetical protein
MALKTLPVPGDNFSGNIFHYCYVAVDSTNFGATDSSQIVALFAIDQPNVWVKEISTRITTAFFAANDISIGDTDDVAGFLTVTGVNCTVIAAVAGPQWRSSWGANSSALASIVGAYAGAGKLYTDTTKTIDLTFTSNTTAGHTVGAMQVCAVYTVLP